MDRTKVALKKLNAAKDIMVQNIDKILEREEQIDMLVKKTQVMHNLSTNMKRQVQQTKPTNFLTSLRRGRLRITSAGGTTG